LSRLAGSFFLILTATFAAAQTPAAPSANASDPEAPPAAEAPGPDSVAPPAPLRRGAGVAGLLLHDQRLIFLSPSRITVKDAKWLVPLTGAFTFLLTSDRKNIEDRIHPDALWRARSAVASDAGVAVLAGIPLLLYWHGWRNADSYARDTGLLSARAVVDTLVASEAIRLAMRRDRPFEGNGAGDFFHAGGASSSFPSMHAATAWALASVVAGRYPGWLTQAGAYGLAAAVSLSSVSSREHFPSDVLAGSVLGWLVGRYVSHTGMAARAGLPAVAESQPAPVRKPAVAENQPARANTLAVADSQPAPVNESAARSSGSPYVPLDSWVYTALERLAAVGLIPSQTSGMRPWTRAECRRQLLEADQGPSEAPAGASVLLTALHRELDGDSAAPAVVLESVWVRSGAIAGPVLNDSMHFGQTWNNDFGRPFGRGWNSDAGFTARMQAGRFFGAIQGEYQRAPGSGAYAAPVQQTVAQLDDNPVQDSGAQIATSRFRTVEAYAGVRLGDFDVSVGKQALWWGPTYDSPLSFGDNAEPTKNMKISTQHPFRLPGVLRHLGEIRGEFVIGKLGGQKYTWRPWFNAQKISFKLTPNLEMGFTRWSIFWGVGHPITLGSFLRNFASLNSPSGAAGLGRDDPGDRKGGFDFRYRLPGLRNWLTLYSDSYCDDDPSPLAAPRRAAINPGLYLAHVPGVPHLDFRVEAPSTTPLGLDKGGQFIYYNDQYHSGNTNYGELLGNSVGRDSRAIEGWSTYWFSARSNVQLGYRQLKGSSLFLPGGSTQSDGTIKASFKLADGWYVGAMFQYERFWVPVLGGPRRNLSGWLQLTWEPNWRILL
jgi:membrane-associated phospholipid phosphatase